MRGAVHPNLSDHIAAALLSEANSEKIAALIAEAEQARAVAEERQRKAHDRSLDPTAGADAASAARAETDNMRFEVDRLVSALDALRVAHRASLAREAEGRRCSAYDAAQAERDALAEELRQVYPEIEQRLSGLMVRLAASDDVLARVNRNLPAGASSLTSAEEVARGGRDRFASYQEYTAYRLATRLRIPRFEVTPTHPDAWPPVAG